MSVELSPPQQSHAISPLVIKIGGRFSDDAGDAIRFFEAVKLCFSQRPVILVHGGGSRVERLLKALDFSSEKYQGLRVTPKAHLPYVVGALAGTANKLLAAFAHQAGLRPVGLSLADGAAFTCTHVDEALGEVGKVTNAEPALISLLCQHQYLVIISSIGITADSKLVNVNADDAAVAVAKALKAELMLLSDVPGVLGSDKQLLTVLDAGQIQALVADGVIKDGMSVKVSAALDAANVLQAPVTIGSYRNPQIIFTHSESHGGTIISPTAE